MVVRATRRLTAGEMLENWIPKTELGRQVKSGEITDIETIFSSGRRILEPEIVDMLVPGLEMEILQVGQSKGKFGGGKRSIWRQTQKTTRQSKNITFSSCVVVGNRNGLVGMGFGAAQETVPAREKAIRQAKLNLIRIIRGNGAWEQQTPGYNSIPFALLGKCGSLRVHLLPAPQGIGLCVEKECSRIFRLAGISDVWSQTYGHTATKLNFVRACFDALRSFSSVKMRSEDRQSLHFVVGRIN